ncbi:MAG: hypothetical protein PHE29_14995 [Tissierellia bacterium]|nr:hypothetical protein [Tissierellia bacterium]
MSGLWVVELVSDGVDGISSLGLGDGETTSRKLPSLDSPSGKVMRFLVIWAVPSLIFVVDCFI